MHMALKQQQELKQTQRLSPLQMQVIKLVELNTVEVEDRIKQEVEDNPALETGSDELSENTEGDEKEKGEEITQDEMMLGDYLTEEDIPDYHIAQQDRRNDARFGRKASHHCYLYHRQPG